jgi:hypothetical protein
MQIASSNLTARFWDPIKSIKKFGQIERTQLKSQNGHSMLRREGIPNPIFLQLALEGGVVLSSSKATLFYASPWVALRSCSGFRILND